MVFTPCSILNYIFLGSLGTADLIKATIELLVVALVDGMKLKVTIKILMLIIRRKLCSRISLFKILFLLFLFHHKGEYGGIIVKTGTKVA